MEFLYSPINLTLSNTITIQWYNYHLTKRYARTIGKLQRRESCRLAFKSVKLLRLLCLYILESSLFYKSKLCYNIEVSSFNRFRSYLLHKLVVGVAQNHSNHSIWKPHLPVFADFSCWVETLNEPLKVFDWYSTLKIIKHW